MEEKEFFMPDLDKDVAIEKWNEFNKIVNGDSANDYSIPVYEFSYKNKRGRHSIARVGEPFDETNKIILAIVQSDNGMVVYTKENLGESNQIIEKYNRGAEKLFTGLSEGKED